MKATAFAIGAVFFGPLNTFSADYVPAPNVVQTSYLTGAMYFPGWKEGTHYGWGKITPFPERKPVLGWYDEGNPEVTDWEIKWCVEHGISFFVYCWFRSGGDTPVQTYLGHAIHDGLFNAKYRDKFQFSIMWENANGKGVSSESDLMNNLFPYWIKTYFKHPSYLRVDGKPVLFVYSYSNILRDLGNADNVHAALDKMRSAAVKEGFRGLLVLCECRSLDRPTLEDIKRCGFDETFAYCWGMKEANPTPTVAIQTQLDYMSGKRDLGIIPFVPTVSMGWDPRPWQPDAKQHWQIPPSDFKTLCQKTKSLMDALPPERLGHRMLLLDNWNEWGEGHYVAPCAQNGFGYLDAVREIFTTAPNEHQDLTPADVGRGPYDSLFGKINKISPPNTK